MYSIIAHHPDGYRVTVEYEEPDRALEAFEAAGKRVLVTVGAKVQLLDGSKLVSDLTGPAARPARDLTSLLRKLDPEYQPEAEEGGRLGSTIATAF